MLNHEVTGIGAHGQELFHHQPNGPDGLIHWPSTHTEQMVTQLNLSPGRGDDGSPFCKYTAGSWSLWWSEVNCQECHDKFSEVVDAAVQSVSYRLLN